MCDPFEIRLASDGRTKWRCTFCGKDYETRTEAELTTCRVGPSRPIGTPRSSPIPEHEASRASESDFGSLKTTDSKGSRISFLRERIDRLERDLAFVEKSSSSGWEAEEKRTALGELREELAILEGRPGAPVSRAAKSRHRRPDFPNRGSRRNQDYPRSVRYPDTNRRDHPNVGRSGPGLRNHFASVGRRWRRMKGHNQLRLLYLGIVAILFGYLLLGRIPPTASGSYLWSAAFILESIAPVYVLYRLFLHLSRIRTRSRGWFALVGLAAGFMADVYILVYLFFSSFFPGSPFYYLSYAPAYAPPNIAKEIPWVTMTFDAVLIPFLILGIGIFFAMDYIGYRMKRHYVVEMA